MQVQRVKQKPAPMARVCKGKVMSEVAIIPPNVVPLKSGGRVQAIIPDTVEEVFRIAKAVAASGLAPNGMKSAEQITIAIMHGAEIGLPPMQAIQRIAVVNGRPTIWGDAVPALLLSRGFKLREWETDTASFCEVTRPDGTKIERSFSDADAKAAGLLGKSGPWTQYVLAGLYISEEVQELDTPAVRKSSAECKRDGTTERFNGIRAEIKAATTLADVDRIEATHEAEIATMAVAWARIVNDELAARRADLADPVNADAVLREIEKALASKSPTDVLEEYKSALMSMDDDSRAMALEMIEAARTAAE
jgi:hypothetical protein